MTSESPTKPKRFISTPRAPTPGAYSQAVRMRPETHDPLVLAGQTANTPGVEGEPVVYGGIGPQTKRILQNMLAIVEAAGGDAHSFVSMTVYIKDVSERMPPIQDRDRRRQEVRGEQRKAFNDAYVAFFAERGRTAQLGNMPARTQVWVSEIPWESEDTRIEIAGVAEVPRQHAQPIDV